MKINRIIRAAWVMAAALIGSASAEVLMEVDFSGSGGVTTIAATDGQVTTHPNINYEGSDAMAAVGGSLSTSGWVMDGTGDAAVNPDLHVGSAFGAPTRFDLFLGLADAGYTYTITNVEIVVRAAASTSKNWDFMYRDTSSANQILAGSSIAVQSGADPRTTYSIDLTAENLFATDTAVNWDPTRDLRIAFWEAEGLNNDNLQIDAVRLNGTVIPEPATLGLVVAAGAGTLIIRRRFMV